MSEIAPFRHRAEVKDRNGVTLASVSVSISASSQDPGSASEQYAFDATIRGDGASAALVNQRNRLLVVESGETYRVVETRWRPVIDFVEARLRLSKADG